MKIKYFEYLKKKFLSIFASKKHNSESKLKTETNDKDKRDDIYPLW